ncbi:MAG TPA: hypothetical protein VE172_20375 [Stackebrandtia sp.]|jgi:hypothetical protein|uniref:hypothetical protein n=1 Tax=Stackebrandtia sp. TaxID=2023065 RepID=UPI002D5F9EA0|nr:hypothetical protein [Stackebrandtia sp.]HZE41162.1 hypothetical protein [Stackebrandtia sp.]
MLFRDYKYRPLAARIITFVFGAIAAIILLHLAFIVLDANDGNPLVIFVSNVADWFAYLFKNLFTLDNFKWQAVLNYGIAAVIYLLVGGGLSSLFRRGGPAHT